MLKAVLTAITLTVLAFSLQAQIAFGPATTAGAGGNPQSLAALDLNGDGWLDLVVANDNDNTLTVEVNNHAGGFVFSYSINVSSPEQLTAVDLNGDHLLDLVCGNYYQNTLTILTNNGVGGFIVAGSPAVGVTPTGVVATDVNKDGKTDLVAVNSAGNTLSILTNTGTGDFFLTSSPAVATQPISAAALDINNDGYMDVVCSSYASNILSVLTNDGKGGFKFAYSLPTGSSPFFVITADLNGDGKLDVACGNFGGNTLSIFTNNGVGDLVLSSSPVVGSSPEMVVAADFNGDGKMDIGCANYNNNSITVLTNDGQGGFVLAATLPVGTQPVGLIAADINNDGKPDLICANSGGNNLTVYTNATPFPSPVIITVQPTNEIVANFSPAVFSVTAAGYPPPNAYQWTFNGTNVPGATSNMFTIPHVSLTNCGNYQVQVGNGVTSTNSVIVTLNMSPSITSPFEGASTIWGTNTDLSVGATGSGLLTYQWYQDGVAVSGATNANLDFSMIQFTNGGFYSVVISSAYGSITNGAAQVVVNPSVFSMGFSPTLTINGTPGYSYVIQRSADLSSTNNWITVTNLTLTSAVQLFVDTNIDTRLPGMPVFFYRILPGQ